MDRFISKIEKTDTCWLWTGAKRHKGYGAFKFDSKVIDAHRFAYILFKGEIKDNLFVLHTCDNRACVNPEHLFLGTNSDNMKDCYKKGRLKLPIPQKIHGTRSRYKSGCRCEKCRIVANSYLRKYRASKK